MRVKVMVFNATFNNISVLLVEQTGVPGENHAMHRRMGKHVPVVAPEF
jgi:hypothetical protein